MVGSFDFAAVEAQARALWEKQQVYPKAKAQGAKGEKFYFLDGPPYTSGSVHLGTAWNKILKDITLRYKRMTGHNVWDRAGYDMHGLPTEHATEKELGIHGRDQIQQYGSERFIEACRALCLRNMHKMNSVFIDLGIWMDFEHAYQSISREFMEGEWWFIKQAHEKGRLYEGERTMTWDPSNATALAKHELEYRNITDTAIYVKLPLKEEKAFLVIWTTTPWTIPFNLAVMANPDLEYCRIAIDNDGTQEQWYIAKDRLDPFIRDELEQEYTILQTLRGKELEGKEYTHPFADKNPVYAKLKAQMQKVHTVLMSAEHVDTSAGTGLVHCAPGCGPEDYEVGHRNGIKPFNTLDEQGFCKEIVPFVGLEAKKDDGEFARLIGEAGALVHQHKYTHEYPHGERSHEPVVFRTTKQWFLRIEDIKPRLIQENDRIAWNPTAAYNAFSSWLENLRDNSISKQRYWGTPIPIWRNVKDPSDYLVVGSAQELKDLAQLDQLPEDLHIPTVDKIVIKQKGKDGTIHEYRRIPDVLDVWVDAGTASWNCLHFPARKDLLKEFYPAAFILEGKDQIRGWFNLLHLAGIIAMDKPAFKAAYMHGYINDSQGRKMSKSLGNYITPDEVTKKYGVDATRLYMVSAANPGLDMNYNFEDLEAKFKNLLVYWNMHKYALEMTQSGEIVPQETLDDTIGIEERYLLSRLNTAIKQVTERFETYRLNETTAPVEEFLLDMSRTYIQLVRDKATAGSDEEKTVVASALLHSLRQAAILLAPAAPFFAEQLFQNIKEAHAALCSELSVHLCAWPTVDEERIDVQLEADFLIAKDAIAAILAARDKAQLGVRWPVQEVRIECTPAQQESLRRMLPLISLQTNIKDLGFEPVDVDFTIEPNSKMIGKEFGKETQAVMALVTKHNKELAQMLKDRVDHLVLEGKTIKEQHLNTTRQVPDKYQMGEGNVLFAYLDTTRTPELEREGYAREIIRRIQQLRKNAGLVKANRITVELAAGDELLQSAIEEHQSAIAERTGSSRLQLVPTLSQSFTHISTEKVKGISFSVGFSVLE